MKFKATERYAFGWTDYRAVYGTPSKRRWWRFRKPAWLSYQLVTNLVGTFIIWLPIAIASYWFWKWMGWL